jgi:hypothetical protein
VNVDSNPSAPFASCRAYTWTQGTPPPDSLAEQRIHAAVGAQLAAFSGESGSQGSRLF